MLIINDKKTTFKGVNILTYFFTRNAPNISLLDAIAEMEKRADGADASVLFFFLCCANF